MKAAYFSYKDPLGLSAVGPNSAEKFYNANVIDQTLIASTENILELEPEMQEKIIVLCREAFYYGLLPLVYSGRRSFDYQLELYNIYKKGGNVASTPGSSYHNYGWAVDMMIIDREGGNAMPAGYGYLQAINLKLNLGLIWGGNFKTIDKPHFQFEKYSISYLKDGSEEYQNWLASQSTDVQWIITEEDMMQAAYINEVRQKRQKWWSQNYGWIFPTVTALSAAVVLIFVYQVTKYFNSKK